MLFNEKWGQKAKASLPAGLDPAEDPQEWKDFWLEFLEREIKKDDGKSQTSGDIMERIRFNLKRVDPEDIKKSFY